MYYRDLVNILLKVAGVAIITFAIINIPASVSYYVLYPEDSILRIITTMIPICIPLVIGCVFLLFPSSVSNKLIQGNTKTDDSDINVEAVEKITFSALGLYLMFRVVSDFSYHIASILLGPKDDVLYATTVLNVETYSLLFATIVEFIFASYLLLGSASIVSFLKKLRKS